ncbi:hypothetical protein MRB53_035075 [Persea americana]|uniref:Uncharacterized protein n=1 Tax=Persea americana TaxID=3435 RepID=A0ACC2K484_PERAE|nr:hypothetical protein MRB53_035075 [Persea americana]
MSPCKCNEVYFADLKLHADNDKGEEEHPIPLIDSSMMYKEKDPMNDDPKSTEAFIEPPIPPMAPPIPATENPKGDTFIVYYPSALYKPIVFHRAEMLPSSPVVESFVGTGKPQFYRYNVTVYKMMEKMDYDMKNPMGLSGGRGILTPIEAALSEEQREDLKIFSYLTQSSYGLGYRSMSAFDNLSQKFAAMGLTGFPFSSKSESSQLKSESSSAECAEAEVQDEEDEVSSHDTETWQPTFDLLSVVQDELLYASIPRGGWDHHLVNGNEPFQKENPWKGTRPF